METTTLGRGGLEVSRIGLGCWALGGHGWGPVPTEDAVATIRRAYESGVTFFDTADCYGLGRSEELLAAALGPNRHEVVIATKFGVRWGADRRTWHDCSPDYFQAALDASLRRLRLEVIPLLYVHWPDARTPIPEIIGAMRRQQERGKLLEIGLSNHSPAQVEQALQIAPIAALQVRCSLLDAAEVGALDGLTQSHGVGMVAWGVLGQGLLTGKLDADARFGPDDHRSRAPRFQGERLLRNLEVAGEIVGFARRRGVSAAQVAIRWTLSRPGISAALVGAKTPEQVDDNVGAASWRMDRLEWKRLESLGAECSDASLADQGR